VLIIPSSSFSAAVANDIRKSLRSDVAGAAGAAVYLEIFEPVEAPTRVRIVPRLSKIFRTHPGLPTKDQK
jgi:hypothetical protein